MHLSSLFTIRHSFSFLSLVALFALFVMFSSSARAQTRSATDGTTPLAMSPGAPAGSYALSGFENINPYNGNLDFALPMLQIGGRGGTPFTMMLRIERHWRVEHTVFMTQGVSCDPEASCTGSAYDWYTPTTNWWTANGVTTLDGPQGPGSLRIRYEALPPSNCEGLYRRALTRLTFTAPDGTE